MAVLLGSIVAAACAPDVRGQQGRSATSSAEVATTVESLGGDAAADGVSRPAVDRIDEREVTGDPAADLYDGDEVHTFDLVVAPDDLAVLDADPVAEQYVDGFLDFDGRRYGPIGVRYKGSVGSFTGCLDGFVSGRPTGAKTCTKLSLKLKFDGRYGVDFFGVDKVQLHAQNLDPTMMHERLGYAMFRAFGVPAPRSNHARVTMNGELLGVFALTEQIDEEFLPTVFDEATGNLYKEAWPVADDPSARSPRFFVDRLRTNEDDPLPIEPIIDLGRVVAAAEPGERLAAIESRVEVDAWFRYLVVDRAIGHDDGPLRFDCNGTSCRNKNFYLYQHPTTDEIAIIAWDLDTAFATLTTDRTRTGQLVLEIADDWNEVSRGCEAFAHGPFDLLQRSPACDPLIAAFAEEPERYDEFRQEFLDGPYSVDSVDSLLEEWSDQIEPFVAEAASAHPDATSVEVWRAEIEVLRADIAAERAR